MAKEVAEREVSRRIAVVDTSGHVPDKLRNSGNAHSRFLNLRHDVVAVHAGDEVDGDLLRADRLALAEHRAAAEVLLHHLAPC